MPPTDTACRSAKGRETEYKLSDGGGLYLLVKPSGARLWNQAYRFSGKQKKLSHGAYPSFPLVEARRLRDEAKKLLASGVDPGANKKAAKLTAVISATNTFGGVAEEYLQRIEDEGAAASTITKNRWLLVDLAGPDLGARPIADITPAEILALLQRIERSGRRETARRLRSVENRRGQSPMFRPLPRSMPWLKASSNPSRLPDSTRFRGLACGRRG